MPTTTVFATAADGYIISDDVDYADARSGSNGANVQPNSTAGFLIVGQQETNNGYPYYVVFYECMELFLSFDTSAIINPTAVDLMLRGFTDNTVTDFIMEARLHDWGTSLTAADWVAGASLGSKTLLAEFNTTGYTTSGYNTFTETSGAFTANLNLVGETRILVNSSRHRNSNTPNTREYLHVFSTEEGGTTSDPKIVVTTSGSSSVARGISANMGVSIPTSGAVTIGAGES